MAVLEHVCALFFAIQLSHLKFTITQIPADDLLQAVNSVTLAHESIFCTHSTDCTCIRNGKRRQYVITNKCVPLRYVLASRLFIVADLHTPA